MGKLDTRLVGVPFISGTGSGASFWKRNLEAVFHFGAGHLYQVILLVWPNYLIDLSNEINLLNRELPSSCKRKDNLQ